MASAKGRQSSTDFLIDGGMMAEAEFRRSVGDIFELRGAKRNFSG